MHFPSRSHNSLLLLEVIWFVVLGYWLSNVLSRELFDNYGLVNPDEGVIEKRKQMSKELRRLSHRLEQIRVLAMPHDFD